MKQHLLPALRSVRSLPQRDLYQVKQLYNPTAILEAIRPNEKEAPQREIERQNMEKEGKRAAEQKARPANKAGFRS